MQMQLPEPPCKSPAEMTDVEFLEDTLRHGPATTNEILRRSFALRGVGLTVHSRAADLRQRLYVRGETVVCKPVGVNTRGRQEYRYELVAA